LIRFGANNHRSIVFNKILIIGLDFNLEALERQSNYPNNNLLILI